MALDSRVITTLVPLMTQSTGADRTWWRLRLGWYQTRFRRWDVAVKRVVDTVTIQMRDVRGQALGQEDYDDDRARDLHDAILAQTADPATVSITRFIAQESLDRVYLPVVWQESNVTANQATGVELSLIGLSMTQFALPRAGSILALGIMLSQAVTAGLLRLEITRNGTDTGKTFDVTSGDRKLWEFEAGELSFNKGQELGVKWGSNAALSPTGFELDLVFEVQWTA